MLLMQDRVLGETVSEGELASLLVLVITPFNLWLQTFCIWLSARIIVIYMVRLHRKCQGTKPFSTGKGPTGSQSF